MSDYLQPPSKQSSLGKRPNQDDLGGADKRLMENDTTAELKSQKIKMEMKRKPHYVERQIKMKVRIFCCYCEVETGRDKGRCVKCGHPGCGECLFYQSLSREFAEGEKEKVGKIHNDFEERLDYRRDKVKAATNRFL